jgi:thiamine-phosphate diphosphorylase
MLLGVSTHSLQEVDTAERSGADFVVFGLVFDTSSKIKYGAPIGLESLTEVAERTKLPVIAIGGITEENYHSVLTHGASGIAAIKMFAESDSLVELVSRLKTIDDAYPAITRINQK